jgi:hypothetical protein
MTNEQTDLFNQAAKEEAIDRVERNANPDWKEAALKSVQHRARHCASVTANDVFADLEQLGLHTHENRALGAVFQKAARNGWIAKTDRTVPSTRKTRHSGDVRVWASQLEGAAA